MNILVFCRALGDINVNKLDYGSDIIDTLNTLSNQPDNLFSVDMTGPQIRLEYDKLPLSIRNTIRNHELLSEDKWFVTTTQIEHLTAIHELNKTKVKMVNNNIFLFFIGLLYAVSFVTIGNYYTLTEFHKDNVESKIIHVIGELLTLLKQS